MWSWVNSNSELTQYLFWLVDKLQTALRSLFWLVKRLLTSHWLIGCHQRAAGCSDQEGGGRARGGIREEEEEKRGPPPSPNHMHLQRPVRPHTWNPSMSVDPVVMLWDTHILHTHHSHIPNTFYTYTFFTHTSNTHSTHTHSTHTHTFYTHTHFTHTHHTHILHTHHTHTHPTHTSLAQTHIIHIHPVDVQLFLLSVTSQPSGPWDSKPSYWLSPRPCPPEIGRASCRERV